MSLLWRSWERMLPLRGEFMYSEMEAEIISDQFRLFMLLLYMWKSGLLIEDRHKESQLSHGNLVVAVRVVKNSCPLKSELLGTF